jgi:hypothetical protein
MPEGFLFVAAIIESIEMFDNSERVHQAFDYRTHNEIEAKDFDHELALTPISRECRLVTVR